MLKGDKSEAMSARRKLVWHYMRLVRLSAAGAILGIAVAGVFGHLAGIDRTVTDTLGGAVGFVGAFAVLAKASLAA
jgi:hypothetical protein